MAQYLKFVQDKSDIIDNFPAVKAGNVTLPVYKGISYNSSGGSSISFVPAGGEYCTVVKKTPKTLSVAISRFASDNAITQLSTMKDAGNPITITDEYGGNGFEGFVTSVSNTNVTFKEATI